MTWRLSALLAMAAIATLVVSGGGDGSSAGVTVSIHYSQFTPEVITVPAGVPVTITLRNDDPIEHEWIVGPPVAHERHRTGTEPVHAGVPTEITIPAFSTRVTTVTFDKAADYAYICHLPGHEDYGMVGTLRILDR
ncbi:MAG: cupredoxin domain-containing protein [Chloroflexi bacterium]|nr:cupredoxin domain-containing protein [Chloroflexota bacterium]